MRNASHTKTARFWVYANSGWVRLALRDGDEISHCEHESHEEGFSTEWNTWERDGSAIVNTWSTADRCCDGNFSRDGAHESSTRELEAHASEEICGEMAPARPVWTQLNSRQRDYSAEAAGY